MRENKLVKLFFSLLERFRLWQKNQKQIYRDAKWYKKIYLIIAKTFIYFLIFLFLVDMNFLWLFGKSPGLSGISNPDQSIASEVYSADGKLIGKLFKENRTPVKYEEISPILIKTLVATEDERFYNHFGIDIQGLFAAVKDMAQGRARGASTITQQLAKNMYKTRTFSSKGVLGYVPGVKMVIMKAKEWINAVKIEIFYSKEEILTMYLNTVDFGSNAYGIKTACKTYFDVNPKDLTYEQAATLVGMLKATTTYNPRINPENSKKRRNVVLDNLAKQKVLSKHECDSIKQIPIKLKFKVAQNYDGEALYFREAVVESLREWCKENEVDLYADGLKIYTTVDSRMQKYAEEAVQKQMRQTQRNFKAHWGEEEPWRDENQEVIRDFITDIAKKTKEYKALMAELNDADSVMKIMETPRKMKVFTYRQGKTDTIMSPIDSIKYMERFMHTGFIAIEPQTRHVKAWVGDINFDFWKYDKVTSKRQPGSTFKLFVYSAAMNNGMEPCEKRRDEYLRWEYMEKGQKKEWTPRNATGNYSGDTVTLKYAFARSMNSVAARIGKEVGIDSVIKMAYALGIKTPLNHIPSVCLGSSDVSLLELVNSYATIINDGKLAEPILVTKIVDKEGNVIFEAAHEEKEAVPYETAFLMQQMLKAGLTEPMGTSQALWAYDLFRWDTDFGGKTGTSSRHSDAWYVGVTPKLVGGAWVGGEHRCIHFRTGHLGEGSKTALPIFGLFMEKVLADENFEHYRARFDGPKVDIERSYKCATPYPVKKDSTDFLADSLIAAP